MLNVLSMKEASQRSSLARVQAKIHQLGEEVEAEQSQAGGEARHASPFLRIQRRRKVRKVRKVTKVGRLPPELVESLRWMKLR